MSAPARTVVVGAGPAGLSAALELAVHGVPCRVLEARDAVGGASGREPAVTSSRTASVDVLSAATARHLRREVAERAGSVEVVLGAEVVGHLGPGRLTVSARGRLEEIGYERLVLALGCHERAQPFPGWTLPGVRGAAGVRERLVSAAVLPGRRVAVLGGGPVALLAARQLHRAGAHVVGVFEPAGRDAWREHVLRRGAGPAVLAERREHARHLHEHGVPLRFGCSVVRAEGRERVERLVVRVGGGSGGDGPHEEVTVEVDAVATSHGLVPRTQLSRAVGCEHAEDAALGGHVPVVDAGQRTSVAGVYAAGDGAAVLGWEAACAQGRLAARSCLVDLGVLDPHAARAGRGAAWERQVSRARAAARARPVVPGEDPAALAARDPGCVVCRCEGVTAAQVQRALDAGATTAAAVKMRTRLGMGACQGAVCSPWCAQALRAGGRPPGPSAALRPRFPMVPVPLGSLAAAAVATSGSGARSTEEDA